MFVPKKNIYDSQGEDDAFGWTTKDRLQSITEAFAEVLGETLMSELEKDLVKNTKN